MTTLLVELPGRHANQVIAYLSSRYLQMRYGFNETRYSSLLTFMGATLVDTSSLMTRTDQVRCRLPSRHSLTGHLLSDEKVTPLLSKDIAVAKGFFQRCEYFYDPFRTFFEERGEWARSLSSLDVPDLTVHVRGGDVWRTKGRRRVHPDYPALPLSYYRQIRDTANWRTVKIVTDDPRHVYTRAVSRVFNAEVQSSSGEEDMAELARARNLVLSVSTYALLGALASRAERVFYPSVGLFNSDCQIRSRGAETPQLFPASRPEFTQVAAKTAAPWLGSQADLAYLLHN